MDKVRLDELIAWIRDVLPRRGRREFRLSVIVQFRERFNALTGPEEVFIKDWLARQHQTSSNPTTRSAYRQLRLAVDGIDLGE